MKAKSKVAKTLMFLVLIFIARTSFSQCSYDIDNVCVSQCGISVTITWYNSVNAQIGQQTQMVYEGAGPVTVTSGIGCSQSAVASVKISAGGVGPVTNNGGHASGTGQTTCGSKTLVLDADEVACAIACD